MFCAAPGSTSEKTSATAMSCFIGIRVADLRAAREIRCGHGADLRCFHWDDSDVGRSATRLANVRKSEGARRLATGALLNEAWLSL